MRILLIALVVTLTIATTSAFSTQEGQQILALLNDIRGSVSPPHASGGFAPLQWSSDLYANVYNVSAACNDRYMSELAAVGATGENTFFFNSEPTPYELINAIKAPGGSFNYDDISCADGVDCSIYTNVINDQTTQVACNKAYCSANQGWKVVCGYFPAGSFAGVSPYPAQPHASTSKLDVSNINGLLSFHSNKMIQSEPEIEKLSMPKTGNFDWREKGVVGIPEDSIDCADSFAFTATGIYQSRIAMSKGIRTSLSKQQILDCSGSANENYCSGGNLNDALLYVRDNGLMKTTDYPYTGASTLFNHPCKYDESKIVVDGGYVRFSEPTKADILSKCRDQGPLGVAMLGTQDFYDYRGGVFRCNVGQVTATNHSVLLVGYNQDQDYYIVRNNWGTQWGEQGFARISALPNEDCGIGANRAGSVDLN
ncbi:hypothetical protein SAMD00019534_022680 [Acytostelium subglobosum LB1]|uniref:hypothetical protein n=1 Tax=Acytostelium subglobosum LB1 TaxID=1410327 RepID=UPI0006452269|nr:hypothetical protein SAMD00019534_022680 [Acytostelium subglobosum LB1]GAM19093.1 hypothetical protein SAMD00019534_022680 [Acytostelium subglobosum LB1]|eukprot:XP_012757020.1 hypothetical protein SAMD00019534_022680 [Acytostelium subglobosum LB1]